MFRSQGPMMNLNKRKREEIVGAPFIGAPPIHRPVGWVRQVWSPVVETRADESAMGAINRPLQDIRFRLLPFIIGDGRDQSAPT